MFLQKQACLVELESRAAGKELGTIAVGEIAEKIRPDMIFRKKLDRSFHNHEHQATSHPSQDARTIRL